MQAEMDEISQLVYVEKAFRLDTIEEWGAIAQHEPAVEKVKGVPVTVQKDVEEVMKKKRLQGRFVVAASTIRDTEGQKILERLRQMMPPSLTGPEPLPLGKSIRKMGRRRAMTLQGLTSMLLCQADPTTWGCHGTCSRSWRHSPSFPAVGMAIPQMAVPGASSQRWRAETSLRLSTNADPARIRAATEL